MEKTVMIKDLIKNVLTDVYNHNVSIEDGKEFMLNLVFDLAIEISRDMGDGYNGYDNDYIDDDDDLSYIDNDIENNTYGEDYSVEPVIVSLFDKMQGNH